MWRTPTPLENIRTKKFGFGFLFLPRILISVRMVQVVFAKIRDCTKLKEAHLRKSNPSRKSPEKSTSLGLTFDNAPSLHTANFGQNLANCSPTLVNPVQTLVTLTTQYPVNQGGGMSAIKKFNPRSIARFFQPRRPRSNLFNPRALWDGKFERN